MNSVRKHGFLICLTFVFFDFLKGQEPTFQHLNIENGLSETTNYAVFQDSRKLVWISSINGLNRFDGQKVIVYQPILGDSCSIMGNNIQSGFEEDRHGDIWFSTYEAVNRYNRKTGCFQHYFLSDSANQPISGYYFIGLDSFDCAWLILQPNRLFKLDIAQNTFSQIGFVKPSTQAGKLVLDKNGKPKFVLSTSQSAKTSIQINFLDVPNAGQTIEIFSGRSGAPDFQYGAFEMKGADTLWATVPDGALAWFDITTKKYGIWEKQNFEQQANLQGFAHLDDNKAWVGSDKNGLRLCEKLTGKTLLKIQNNPSDLKSLSGNQIESISKTADQTLWINVKKIGLDYFNNSKSRFAKFKIPNQNPGLSNFNCRSLLESTDGSIWLGYEKKGVVRIDKHGKLYELENVGLASPIRFMMEDDQKRVWFFGWRGFGFWDLTKNKYQKVSEKGVFRAVQLPDKSILFSEFYGGVYKIIEKKTDQFSIESVAGFPAENIFTSIFLDKFGRLWACRDANRIVVFENKNGNWQLLQPLEIGGDTRFFLEDSKTNTLWLASSEGLVKVSLTDFSLKKYNQQHGLSATSIKSILQDKLGFLWLGTSKGITRFEISTEKFQNFDRSDGLPGLVFNDFSAVKKSDGTFWFGCENGIAVFDPTNFKLLENHAKPLITNILVNDLPDKNLSCRKTGATNLEEIRSLRLDYRRNTLSFDFVLPDFSDPSKNRYRFQMEGLDPAPVESGIRGFARYADLQPKKYCLLVWGANCDGIWNNEPTRLDIEIRPPFWQTWWFVTAMVFAFLSIVFGIYRYRIAQIHRENQLVQQKTSAELNALRAFINPHFLFNALNSLNSFILTKKSEAANIYLDEFAKLMRQMLDHAQKSVVNLHDELELNELYMKVERRRFQFPFDFEISVADEIDQFDTFIPSMILQPFVENAIWHGLQNRTDPGGFLKINIQTDEKYLICSIEDNGVGRARAAELKSRQGQKHRSQGLNITRMRLEKLAGSNRAETFDLTDGAGNPAGTRVVIRIDKNLEPE